MDNALAILKSLVDERPEPSMGSEYMGAQPYLLRSARIIRERDAKKVAHGSNDSDFGAAKLLAD
jgi:hypothetical protein